MGVVLFLETYPGVDIFWRGLVLVLRAGMVVIGDGRLAQCL